MVFHYLLLMSKEGSDEQIKGMCMMGMGHVCGACCQGAYLCVQFVIHYANLVTNVSTASVTVQHCMASPWHELGLHRTQTVHL